MAKKTNNLLNHPAFAALRLGEQVFEAQEFTPKSENSAVGTDHGITLKLYGRKSDAFKKAYPAHQAAMAKAEDLENNGNEDEATKLRAEASIAVVVACCVDWSSEKADLGELDKDILIELMNHPETDYIATQSFMFIYDLDGKNFFPKQN